MSSLSSGGHAFPSEHFFSLPPSFNSTDTSGSTSSHTSRGLAPNVASLASADYEVDVRTGFLPADRNLRRLPAAWEVWESALDAAQAGGGLRLGGGREDDKLWRVGIVKVSQP